MRKVKKFINWYVKKYVEAYGKMIEMGINPNI